MFTGIVDAMAQTGELVVHSGGGRLVLEGVPYAEDLILGESVAVNGCCLTVVSTGPRQVSFDLLQETLRLTNLGSLTPGTPVNLERAMRVGDRLSGHFVQGHIDGTAPVLEYATDGQDHKLVIRLPEAARRLVVPKGSITINGISLTIALLEEDRFTVWITPHTHSVTTLQHLSAGDAANLEFDFLGKQIDRLLTLRGEW